MSKHTPGPWHAVFNNQGGHGTHYVTSVNGVIGYWHGHKSHHSDNFWRISEADARLIASAPDLLEMLSWAIRFIDTYAAKQAGPATPELNKARTVIAKAKGEL